MLETILLGETPVSFQTVTQDTAERSQQLFRVDVEDLADLVEVRQATKEHLEKNVWYLSPEFRRQKHTQKFQIDLSQQHSVDLYSFQTIQLPVDRVREI